MPEAATGENPMPNATRRLALTMPALLLALPATAQAPAVSLFRVVSPKDDIIIGLTGPELDALGSGSGAERIARRLAAEGQIGAWRYVVGRAPDGSTRHVASGRIAILRQDTYRIEPYSPALPVAPPPA
jgi:hypothetical protein